MNTTLLITRPVFITMDINSIDATMFYTHSTSRSPHVEITIRFDEELNKEFFMVFMHDYNIPYVKFDMFHDNTQFLGCLVKGVGYSANKVVDIDIISDHHIISEEIPPEILAYEREKTIDQLFDID